jgi:hypothetical protein
MKRATLPKLGPWFCWSDGKPFEPKDAAKFRFVLRRTERNVGESFRQSFERVRSVVEKYEATQKSMVISEPGLIRRAWNALTGKVNGVEVRIGAK